MVKHAASLRNPYTMGALFNVSPDFQAVHVATDGHPEPLRNHRGGAWQGQAECTVYFADLRRHLLVHIANAPIVLGCVAWMTDLSVLDTLARCQGVSLLVQKEDFLRPDLLTPASHTGRRQWAQRLRLAYDRLPQGPSRYDYTDTIARDLSSSSDPSIAPVRCVGFRPQAGQVGKPNMHHKFLVFCRVGSRMATWGMQGHDDWEEEEQYVIPYGVWTGSYNLTENSERSLENAVYIQEPDVARRYMCEWAACLAISEPLDWESDYVAPEWRLGT